MRPLVVVGDVLLDRDLTGTIERLAPDAPVPVIEDIVETARPGGAGLAASLAAADGRPVVLVTALAPDAAGRRLASLLAEWGVEVVDLGLDGATPEKVRVRGSGQPVARLDYGGNGGRVGPMTEAARTALAGAAAVLVSDYGRGASAEPSLRAALSALPPRRPLIWDPHPRGAAPVAGVRLATPNRAEAGVAVDARLSEVTTAARALAVRWGATGVVVTLGARGALLVEGDGTPLAVPPAAVVTGDPCGAGDRFASAAAAVLADGGLPSEAVGAGVRAATAFVAAGGATALVRPGTGGAPTHHAPSTGHPHANGGARPDAFAVAAAIRAAGRTVVATGGCFDLLHAGHVRSLQAARALGDCLVVCLNDDDSVRRLKGPGRPLQSVADRTDVLLGLGCVDAVAVFSEDTPERLLAALRPDLFAKGGDYSLATLPEARLLASWGGQAVVLPYLEGRSTTRLVKEAKDA